MLLFVLVPAASMQSGIPVSWQGVRVSHFPQNEQMGQLSTIHNFVIVPFHKEEKGKGQPPSGGSADFCSDIGTSQHLNANK